MGELEKYGLLSASLLLLMAGLLAFFGRDSDADPGAHALSANNEVVERDAVNDSRSRDPGNGPRTVKPAEPVVKPDGTGGDGRTPIDVEHESGGDDNGPRGPGGENGPEADPKVQPEQQPLEPDAPVHYAVKQGDTLSSIAAAHFGDKKHYKLIEQANPGVDSRRLMVGQELILPAKSATTAKPPVVIEPKPKTAGGKALEAAKDAKATNDAKSTKDAKTAKGSKAALDADKAATVAADRAKAAKAKSDDSPRKAKKDGEKAADGAAKKGPREHKVAKGDTLTSIARKYYDDANKWKTIFEANRDKLKSTSIVPEGVVLKIP